MSNFLGLLGLSAGALLTRPQLVDAIKRTNQNLHYVYSIWRTDLDQLQPFYVGKGKARRALCHLYPSGQANRVKRSILEKMRTCGVEPLFVIHASDSADEAALLIERELIQKLGRIVAGTGPLSNLTLGGEGMIGEVWRARRTAHGRSRAVFADGVRYDLLADAAKALGVYPSAIHKRIAAGWAGYRYADEEQRVRNRVPKHSVEHIEKMRSSLDNRPKRVFVSGKTFASMSKAAASLGVSYGTVRKRCRDECNGAYKFIN